MTQAEGAAERNAALAMIELFADRPNRITLGADKGYGYAGLRNEARSMKVTPHVTQNLSRRRSASFTAAAPTPSRGGGQFLQRIEEAFGWSKEIGAMRRTRFCGLARVGMAFGFTAAAYNLVRLPKLLAT